MRGCGGGKAKYMYCKPHVREFVHGALRATLAFYGQRKTILRQRDPARPAPTSAPGPRRRQRLHEHYRIVAQQP